MERRHSNVQKLLINISQYICIIYAYIINSTDIGFLVLCIHINVFVSNLYLYNNLQWKKERKNNLQWLDYYYNVMFLAAVFVLLLLLPEEGDVYFACLTVTSRIRKAEMYWTVTFFIFKGKFEQSKICKAVNYCCQSTQSPKSLSFYLGKTKYSQYQ